jgi:hypothetical protein
LKARVQGCFVLPRDAIGTPVTPATLDSMIVLATRLAYLSCFSCSTGIAALDDRPADGDPIEVR